MAADRRSEETILMLDRVSHRLNNARCLAILIESCDEANLELVKGVLSVVMGIVRAEIDQAEQVLGEWET